MASPDDDARGGALGGAVGHARLIAEGLSLIRWMRGGIR